MQVRVPETPAQFLEEFNPRLLSAQESRQATPSPSQRSTRTKPREKARAEAPSLRNLQQLLDLLADQRRGNKFRRHRVGHDLVDALDAISGHASLRNKLAHPQHDLGGQLGIFAVVLERGGVGIPPRNPPLLS